MYATGDFIDSSKSFNGDDWSPRTIRYMDYISNDLGKKQWDAIFFALSVFSQRAAKAEAIRNCEPIEPSERVPLPASDPPPPAMNEYLAEYMIPTYWTITFHP